MKKKGSAKSKPARRKGFSLIEVLVALFVFSILVTTLSGVYVGFLGTQLKAKETQRNLESAQLALNSLAKTLRTSKILVPNLGDEIVNSIRIFDYSRSSKACMEYSVVGEQLLVKYSTVDVSDQAACAGATMGAATSLIEGRVFGWFGVTLPVDSTKAGMVTTSLQICPQTSTSSVCSSASGNPVNIQTSVSLRVAE